MKGKVNRVINMNNKKYKEKDILWGGIEEEFHEEKEKLHRLEAPPDLENRLREALNAAECKAGRKIRLGKGLIAALLTFALMFSYSFDTLAYYGKKIMGYDSIAYGSIAELNEEGAGQEINKSYTFSNGVQITLEGIMFDEQELVAFYKVQSTAVRIQDVTFLLEIDGINPLRYPASGGRGVMVDDHTQVWLQSFDAPRLYEKWLSLEINMITDKKSETGRIDFTLDRSKAMKRVVKQEIGREIEIEGIKVNFQYLTASRLNTTIQGTIEPLAQLSIDRPGYSRDEQPGLRFDIYVDETYYSTGYAGIHYSGKAEFSSEVFGLPADFTRIDIRNIRISRMQMVDQTVRLSLDTEDLAVAEDLIIKEVFRDKGAACLKIQSKGIPIMGLFIAGEQVKGENDLSDLPASEEAVERIYRFKGAGEEMELKVKAINYSIYSDSSIPLVK